MNKLSFNEITDQQLFDLRSRHDFHAGHVKSSMNLNPKNFKKCASYYLNSNKPLVFVISSEEEDELNNLTKLATDLGITRQNGYLLNDDVPKESLQTIDTVTAGDFLDTTDNYLLLDVRHSNEITRPAPSKNLINIPFEDLVNGYLSLDKNKVIYTLCGSGNRGTAAASYLKLKGLNPKVIKGGIAVINEAQEE